MKNLLPVLTATSLLLTSCGGSVQTKTLQDHLKNPLYAERYYDTLVDTLVELDIQNDPLLKDAGKKATVDSVRRDALAKAKAATASQHSGATGQFIGAKEFVKGRVFFIDSTVYLGPEFEATPGVELHLILSQTVDPRDGKFPDDSAIDVGPILSAYGEQSYVLDKKLDKPDLYRTLVLYDKKLERVYGFAQLAK